MITKIDVISVHYLRWVQFFFFSVKYYCFLPILQAVELRLREKFMQLLNSISKLNSGPSTFMPTFFAPRNIAPNCVGFYFLLNCLHAI